MMKRLTMIAVALLTICSVASAQQSKSDESLEFRPHWSLKVQGGVAHTIGEASFAELISPAAQLSATYNFHHAMGHPIHSYDHRKCTQPSDRPGRGLYAQEEL